MPVIRSIERMLEPSANADNRDLLVGAQYISMLYYCNTTKSPVSRVFVLQ